MGTLFCIYMPNIQCDLTKLYSPFFIRLVVFPINFAQKGICHAKFLSAKLRSAQPLPILTVCIF